jgi:hypothetical protein
MAKIKLTESELRGIIRKIISERQNKINESNNKRIVNVDFETDEFIPFTISAKIYNTNGSYELTDIDDYWLSEGSFDPMFKTEIEEWIINNETKVENKILDVASDEDDTFDDNQTEYNPEMFM